MFDPKLLTRVQPDELVLGEQLPWALYDASGRLLVEKGAVLAHLGALNAHIRNGLFRRTTAPDAPVREVIGSEVPVLQRVEGVERLLASLLAALEQGRPGNYPNALRRLAAVVDELAIGWPDYIIGAYQLHRERNYSDKHPVLTAIVACLIARRARLDPEERLSLLAAALTANLGMRGVMDRYAAHDGPLNTEEHIEIRLHPRRSCELLMHVGVSDPFLLDTVAAHHERLDGSGYPAGLRGDEIGMGASILGVAETFAAGILKLTGTGGHGTRVLRELYVARGTSFRAELVDALVKEVGIFPPGAFVRLKNQEIAVVIRHGQKRADLPVASALVSPRGGTYRYPLIRDASRYDRYTVEEPVSPVLPLPFTIERVWGIQQH